LEISFSGHKFHPSCAILLVDEKGEFKYGPEKGNSLEMLNEGRTLFFPFYLGLFLKPADDKCADGKTIELNSFHRLKYEAVGILVELEGRDFIFDSAILWKGRILPPWPPYIQVHYCYEFDERMHDFIWSFIARLRIA
jgi:hypothetical protein